MKPKDLKSPFTWRERRPAWVEPVLFVPEHYGQHAAFGRPILFNREAPTFIEYCSGNGDWIIERSRLFPEYNWIAVEKRFDRVRKIWSKLNNQNRENVAIVSGEALPFSKYYLVPQSITGCFINFPDPWPKGRHAKHRLFSPEFIEILGLILQKKAQVMIATDDEVWVQQILGQFLSEKSPFTSTLPQPHFVTDWPNYGTSFFEELWRSKGKTIHYLQFLKN